MLLTVLRALADLVMDLLLPRACPGCRRRHRRGPLCPACQGALDVPPYRAVPRPCPPGLPATWAAAPYDTPVRDLVVAHKERGRLDLSPPLSRALAVAAARSRPDAVVWVPSSRRAVRARGYDHARRLAAMAAWSLGVPAVPALDLARRVADQSGLGAGDRAVNLAGAFRATPAATTLQGRRVVVLDDVMTTGASLAEAARALRAVGVDVVGAGVVAAGVRRARCRTGARPPPPGPGTTDTSPRAPPRPRRGPAGPVGPGSSGGDEGSSTCGWAVRTTNPAKALHGRAAGG